MYSDVLIVSTHLRFCFVFVVVVFRVMLQCLPICLHVVVKCIVLMVVETQDRSPVLAVEVQITSVRSDIYALGKGHMHSTKSIKCLQTLPLKQS